MMKSERQRQQEQAVIVGHAYVYEFRLDNGNGFAAVAVSRAGAEKVLKDELPGYVYMNLPSRTRKANDSDFRIYK